jgi:putative DNA primase/helicase
MIDDLTDNPETDPSTPETDDFAASIVGGITGVREHDADSMPDATAVVDLDQQYRFLPESVTLDEPVPGPKEPDKVARFLLYLFADAGIHLKHWRDEWYLYREGDTGGAYLRLGGADNRYAVADAVRTLLADAMYLQVTKDGPEPRPWSPNTSSVREVVEAMASQMRMRESMEVPAWLRRSEASETMPGDEITCVRNGLLWCPREGGSAARTLVDHTPAFFTDTAVVVDYDASARCDRWLKFLDELWPGDVDSHALLQEWFGYVLAGSTGLHKIMTLVGPRRSGKSTIAWVLEQLLGGTGQVDHPTMARLAEPFGLAPMLGKRLAIVGDARIGKSDPAIVEKLLMISGEDPVTVNRKNRDELNVKLGARLMIVSNDMPDLRDSTGALASRFLPLRIRVEGFLGREDFNLKRTLADELPGIFTWALDGSDRLWDREGRFTVGEAVQRSMEEVERSASPIKAFASDCLSIEVGAGDHVRVPKDEVYEAYTLWCASEGFLTKGKSVFFRDLLAAFPGQLDTGRHRVDGRQVQMLLGARLHSEI